MPEDWRSAVIVPLYKGKRERTECKNYRGISLLSGAGKKKCGDFSRLESIKWLGV